MNMKENTVDHEKIAIPTRSKPKTRRRTMVTIVVLSVITISVIAAGIYIYTCTNYWQADYRKPLKRDL